MASGTCPGRHLSARDLLVRRLLDRGLLVRCLLVRGLLVRCLLVRDLSVCCVPHLIPEASACLRTHPPGSCRIVRAHRFLGVCRKRDGRLHPHCACAAFRGLLICCLLVRNLLVRRLFVRSLLVRRLLDRGLLVRRLLGRGLWGLSWSSPFGS